MSLQKQQKERSLEYYFYKVLKSNV